MTTYMISENGDVHGFLITASFDNKEDATAECAELESKHTGYNHQVHEVTVKNVSCGLSDYENDSDNEATVVVKIEAEVNGENETAEFHVQITDGRYRSELGCWITNGSDGDYDFTDTERLIYESMSVIAVAENWIENEKK